MEGSVDSDWGSDDVDRKSVSGYVFKVYGCVVSWQRKKQKCVALSSAEAEYLSLSMATKEGMFVRNLFSEIMRDNVKVVILNDSQSAQGMAKENMLSPRSKHIDIRYHNICDLVQRGKIILRYLCTSEVVADILTKSLGQECH